MIGTATLPDVVTLALESTNALYVAAAEPGRRFE